MRKTRSFTAIPAGDGQRPGVQSGQCGANILAILLLTQGKLTVGELGAVFALIGTLMGSTTQLFSSPRLSGMTDDAQSRIKTRRQRLKAIADEFA